MQLVLSLLCLSACRWDRWEIWSLFSVMRWLEHHYRYLSVLISAIDDRTSCSLLFDLLLHLHLHLHLYLSLAGETYIQTSLLFCVGNLVIPRFGTCSFHCLWINILRTNWSQRNKKTALQDNTPYTLRTECKFIEEVDPIYLSYLRTRVQSKWISRTCVFMFPTALYFFSADYLWFQQYCGDSR